MKKKALCFGINNYPGTINDLNGCVNDLNDWAAKLTSLGFDVEKIQDSEATRNRFITEATFAFADAEAGDIVVFTYSGHGTQVVDTNGDEQDGYDEALYLYDGALTDDMIRETLNEAKEGVKIVFIFDSCFSGTATRKIGRSSPQIRFVKTDEVVVNKVNKKFLDQADMIEVLMSGCSDDEYSYDASINGRYNGAFTYYALKNYKIGDTFNEWYDKIREDLPSSKYPQTPQLEGNSKELNLIAFDPDNNIPEPEPEPEQTWWDKHRTHVIVGIFAAIVAAGILYGVLSR